jgi:uncharacterized membrane-anchored protein YhcB (DUF1043 family)
VNGIEIFNSSKPCYRDLKLKYNDKIGYFTQSGIIRDDSIEIECNAEERTTFRMNNETIIQKLHDDKYNGIFQVILEGEKLDLDFNLKTFVDSFINNADYNAFGNKFFRMFKDLIAILICFLLILGIIHKFKTKILLITKSIFKLLQIKLPNGNVKKDIELQLQEMKDHFNKQNELILQQISSNRFLYPDLSIYPSAPIENFNENFIESNIQLNKETCIFCQKVFANLKSHLNRNKECKKMQEQFNSNPETT